MIKEWSLKMTGWGMLNFLDLQGERVHARVGGGKFVLCSMGWVEVFLHIADNISSPPGIK